MSLRSSHKMRRSSSGEVSFDEYYYQNGVKSCFRRVLSTRAMGLLFPLVEGQDHRNFVLTFSDEEYPLIVNVSSRTEHSSSIFGGVTLLSGEDRFEFLWFEDHIYVILSNYAENATLYSVLSNRPLEDWKWLNKTLFSVFKLENSNVLIR